MKNSGSDDYENTILEILEIEVRMFLSVATLTDPDCRSRIDDMRLHRSSQFAGWSTETLQSYLSDLKHAEETDENLMTLKYARMDGRIPPLSRDPRIFEILDASVQWQKDFIESFPAVMNGGRDIDDFSRYLKAELETYSPATRKLLKSDVDRFQSSGKSMTQAIYRRMAELAGYESLEAMEQSLTEQLPS